MRAWLETTPWDVIVETNKRLCEKAQCGTMHEKSRNEPKIEALWDKNQDEEMTLEQMVMFCKRIHFHEPFVALNGNTIATVAISATKSITPITCTKKQFEDAICTIIAGTVQGREEIILRQESNALENPTLEM